MHLFEPVVLLLLLYYYNYYYNEPTNRYIPYTSYPLMCLYYLKLGSRQHIIITITMLWCRSVGQPVQQQTVEPLNGAQPLHNKKSVMRVVIFPLCYFNALNISQGSWLWGFKSCCCLTWCTSSAWNNSRSHCDDQSTWLDSIRWACVSII